ncbi:Peroxide stress regulator PerR, FUR family protein [Minicystis rosea]|nr:Peroxide stress regulator PerR, FUR family protein [Minicystis rosea]
MDEMLASLRASGLKVTPQRLAIVRELSADETHPTAQELFERLRATQPTMSFATVYNTLDALANAGLCAALSLSPGPARFDPNMRPHHHAVCDRCGLVRDVCHEGAASGACHDGAAGGPKPQAAFHDGAASGPKPQAPAGPCTEDAGGAGFQGLSGPHADLAGFEIRSVERIYRGLCAACASRAAEGTPGRTKTALRPPRP